jgi:hypothetical protein
MNASAGVRPSLSSTRTAFLGLAVDARLDRFVCGTAGGTDIGPDSIAQGGGTDVPL